MPALFLALPLQGFHQYSSNMLNSRRLVARFSLAIAVLLVSLPVLAASQRSRNPEPIPKAAPQARPTVTQARPVPAVFSQGEALSYMATLNEMPAGEGEARLRKEQQEGREVYRFTARARSSEWVDYLYTRRDTAEAVFTVSDYGPISFRLLSEEGERRREYGVRYDPITKALLGSVSKQDRIKEQTVPAAGVYDPVSALYFLRSQDCSPGALLQTEVFTGKGHYRFTARVIGKETIRLGNQERVAIRLHPEAFALDKNPQENLLPQATILWVSADATHIPLKLESEVMLGRIVVELNQSS